RIELSTPSADPVGAASGSITVLVLDAGVVIGATELDLVRRLRAAGSRVLLVLDGTHADLDWQLVRDRSAELLTAAGLDCEIVPGAARLALAARPAADSALLGRSGLAARHARLAALTTDTTTVDTRRSAAATQVLAQTLDRIAQEEALLAAGS